MYFLYTSIAWVYTFEAGQLWGSVFSLRWFYFRTTLFYPILIYIALNFLVGFWVMRGFSSEFIQTGHNFWLVNAAAFTSVQFLI